MAREYRPNAALYNYEQNPQPQANAIDAAIQGFTTGQGLGLRQRQQALLEQEAQRKQSQFEAEQKQKAIENLKVKADLYNAKWFKGMGKDEKNAFHRGFIKDVKDATGIEIDPTSEYHDNDAETSQMLGEIFKDKNLRSDADRRAAAASVLAEAQKRGSDKEYLDELRKTAEFGVGKNDELNMLRLSTLQEQRGFNNDLKLEQETRAKRGELLRNKSISGSIDKYTAAKTLKTMVSGDNPIAEQGAPMFAARMIQGGSQLTDTEAARFGGSKAVQARLTQAAKEAASGGLSAENKKFMQEFADAMQRSQEERLNASINSYVKNTPSKLFSADQIKSIALSITPEDMAQGLDIGAGGGNAGGSEYQKDLQDAAEAVAQGVVSQQEAAKRIRAKYPNGAPR